MNTDFIFFCLNKCYFQMSKLLKTLLCSMCCKQPNLGVTIFFSFKTKVYLIISCDTLNFKEGTRFGPYPIVFFSERDYNLLYAKNVMLISHIGTRGSRIEESISFTKVDILMYWKLKDGLVPFLFFLICFRRQCMQHIKWTCDLFVSTSQGLSPFRS